MKHLLLSIFLLNIILVSGQEQRLSLQQVIDSALLKHPGLQAKKIQLKSAQTTSFEYLNFAPLQIAYKYGNLYTPEKDKAIEISQNFGSPFVMLAQKKTDENNVKLVEAEQLLNEKQIISEIKKAYFNCQYYIELNKVYQEEYDAFLQGYNILILEDSAGNKKMEKLLLESKLAEAEMENKTSYNQLIKAQNTLLQTSYLENETLPIDTAFEIYEIIPSSDSQTRTPAHLFNNVSEQKFSMAKQELNVNKAKLLPSFYASYTLQSINKQNGFNYWSLGISIPILAFSNAAQIKKSNFNTKIAELELYESRTNNDAITANLLTDMNLYFEKLNYFYDVLLKQSSDLMSAGNAQLTKDNSDINLYILAIQQSFKIRKEYLQVILNYNLKAAELEVYAY